MKSASTAWTPKQDETLRVMRAEGRSFSEIGAVVEKTRNACIGRASRLGLDAPSAPTDAVKKFRNERQRQAAVVKPKPAVRPVPAPQPPKPPLADLVAEDRAAKKGWPKPMTPTAVLFLDIPARGRCKFPLWGDDAPIDQRFCCGAPTKSETAAYCAPCHARAFDSTYNRRVA